MGNSSTDHPGSSSFIVIVGGLRLVSSSPTTHRPVTRAHETSSTANAPLAMLELPSSVACASHAACVRTARGQVRIRTEQKGLRETEQNICPGKEVPTLLCVSVGPCPAGSGSRCGV